MKSIFKKIIFISIAIGIFSNVNAREFFNNFDDPYYINNYNSVYKQNYHNKHYKPYKKHKHRKRVKYYNTNNPNITIMVRDSRYVTKHDIKRALRQFLVQNYYYRNIWH